MTTIFPATYSTLAAISLEELLSKRYIEVGESRLHLLVSVYLHILEHEHVVAEPQRFAAGIGHVPENDFPGSDIGKLLQVGIICHTGIEICKNGRTMIVRRMIG